MSEPSNARAAAIFAVIDAVEAYPDIPADTLEPHLEGLPIERRGMAVALHRTVLQRWLTLTHLLNQAAKNPVEKFEAPVQAVLLVGAAELLFFDSPAYAVIDESVEASRSMNRLKALGLINALLRRVSEMVAEHSDQPWQPDPARLPVFEGGGGGGAVGGLVLREALLPAVSNLVRHLSVATSHPRPLVRRWVKDHGPQAAIEIARSGVRTPTLHVVNEHERSRRWDGTHEQLRTWLGGHIFRRVQDPASLRPVASTAKLKPQHILDLCAGRGTKTRQLLAMHPEARITAWDPDDTRRLDLFALRKVVGDRLGVWQPREDETYDLILLDVPCTNTGVLGRRPEARYRWNAERLESLTDLQREIMDRALRHVQPGAVPGASPGASPGAGAHILYSTCSVDPEENADQARWLCGRAEAVGAVGGQGQAEVVHEEQLLPGGTGESAHDGSYHALVRLGV